MGKTCSVNFCKSSQRRSSRLFVLPQNEIIRKKWLLSNPVGWKSTKLIHVCMDHFTEESFHIDCGYVRRRLKFGSVPSIFPKNERAGKKDDAKYVQEDNAGAKDALSMEEDPAEVEEDMAKVKMEATDVEEDAAEVEEDNVGFEEDAAGMKEDNVGIEEDAGGVKEATAEANKDAGGAGEYVAGISNERCNFIFYHIPIFITEN